jgi:2TM domain-containing protein
MKRRSNLFPGNYTAPDQPNQNYMYAEKRVKRMKGFYVHLFVYVIINSIALVTVYNQAKTSSDFWKPQTFWMTLSWGLGLAAHGISVFGTHYLFSRKWEEDKIRKIIDKERKQQNWE